MPNPHPPLSGFPLVILSLIFLTELLQLYKPSDVRTLFVDGLLVALAIFSPLTYFSGYIGVEYISDLSNVGSEYIENHQLIAKLFLLTLIPLLLLRILSKKESAKRELLKKCYFVFLIVSFALVCCASFKGGELVFKHGAGVQLS